jgi:hypothetical protein
MDSCRHYRLHLEFTLLMEPIVGVEAWVWLDVFSQLGGLFAVQVSVGIEKGGKFRSEVKTKQV